MAHTAAEDIALCLTFLFRIESSPLSGARDNAIVADDDCLEVTL
jgi:hypothetical protein